MMQQYSHGKAKVGAGGKVWYTIGQGKERISEARGGVCHGQANDECKK